MSLSVCLCSKMSARFAPASRAQQIQPRTAQGSNSTPANEINSCWTQPQFLDIISMNYPESENTDTRTDTVAGTPHFSKILHEQNTKHNQTSVYSHRSTFVPLVSMFSSPTVWTQVLTAVFLGHQPKLKPTPSSIGPNFSPISPPTSICWKTFVGENFELSEIDSFTENSKFRCFLQISHGFSNFTRTTFQITHDLYFTRASTPLTS